MQPAQAFYSSWDTLLNYGAGYPAVISFPAAGSETVEADHTLPHVLLGWLIISCIHQPQLTTFHLLAVLHIPCVDLNLEIV